MADATRVRILAARTIVSASCLDCFPARERFEQLTHQRRLSDLGSEATNTYYKWLVHRLFFSVQPLCSLWLCGYRNVRYNNHRGHRGSTEIICGASPLSPHWAR